MDAGITEDRIVGGKPRQFVANHGFWFEIVQGEAEWTYDYNDIEWAHMRGVSLFSGSVKSPDQSHIAMYNHHGKPNREGSHNPPVIVTKPIYDPQHHITQDIDTYDSLYHSAEDINTKPISDSAHHNPPVIVTKPNHETLHHATKVTAGQNIDSLMAAFALTNPHIEIPLEAVLAKNKNHIHKDDTNIIFLDRSFDAIVKYIESK